MPAEKRLKVNIVNVLLCPIDSHLLLLQIEITMDLSPRVNAVVDGTANFFSDTCC